jgi:hypothetical protein
MKRTIALCALVIGGLILNPAVRAQYEVQAVRQDSAAAFTDPARLEQIVAPVALYPDKVLMQVLMAATYPLEVVEAERFAAANQGLSAEAAQAALADRNWDPSVKSLVGYPELLKMMSENLDWTRDLGDAFLNNQSALLDAVQRMRQRARDAGQLATTTQQTVTVRDDRIIVIEPASPTVVYVPTYSPWYVYGGWSYPTWYYPRVYRWYPHSGLSFWIGSGSWSTWGSWFWGSPYWAWGGSTVFIDVDVYDRFNHRHGHRHWRDRHAVHRDRGHWGTWRHRPEHRGGVRYRDPAVAREFERRDRRREEAPRAAQPQRVDRVPSGISRDRAPKSEPRRTEAAPRTAQPRRIETSPKSANPRREAIRQENAPRATPKPQRVERATPRPQQVQRATPRPEVRRGTPSPAPRPNANRSQGSRGEQRSVNRGGNRGQSVQGGAKGRPGRSDRDEK